MLKKKVATKQNLKMPFLSAMVCNKVFVDSTKSNLVEHDSNVAALTKLVRQTNKDWGNRVQGMPAMKIIIKQVCL